MEENLKFEQIKSRIEAYYEKIIALEIEDVDEVEFQKMQVELNLLKSRLHAMKGEIKVTEFYKNEQLCKDLIGVLNRLRNSAIAYYKTIRDVVRETAGEEVYLDIIHEAKKRIGR